MVTEREILLVTFDGFNQIFEENLTLTGSKSRAYELTEKEYKESFRENRYSNYNSFRVARSRLFKR